MAKRENMIASCHPSDLASANAFKALGAEALFQNVPVLQKSDIIILAVKPTIVPIALADLKNSSELHFNKLFLSVVMGVTIKQLEKVLFYLKEI